MKAKSKSIEKKYAEQHRDFLAGSRKKLDRRSFLKVSAAALGAAAGVDFCQSFQSVSVARGAASSDVGGRFRFAYISDSHLYDKKTNDRFARALLRAVQDINSLDPQPDFVFYGGDLAQLGRPGELELGAQIRENVKAPLKMMVGEHDWYLDMGRKWRELFGEPTYSWDHKGVHMVTLNSVVEKDFWTARGMTPEERMMTVAGLDNGVQSPFSVGEPQRQWLEKDLADYADDTPIIVFSHSPLYKLYKKWNFWTDDAEDVQAILKRFKSVLVIHGHTHQVLTNRIGNIHFHGMLSTAWPWPYAPEGVPELTVEMNRPDPFNPNDGCGNGEVHVHADGLVDKVCNLWNRKPLVFGSRYTASWGTEGVPPKPNRASY
jgi:3',5'-cyclic AMP phosphodiesterase CpdA